MRLTICELKDGRREFARGWERLVGRVREEESELVLLPEMIFDRWFPRSRKFDRAAWDAAVNAHQRWLSRVPELGPATVVGTCPVNRAGRRFNQGFVWEPDGGLRWVHKKRYLPDEARYWEASWYTRGDRDFRPIHTQACRLGLMICTDLWALSHAIESGRRGVQVIAVPRATEKRTTEKWLSAGKVAAVLAGAYCISSNRAANGDSEVHGGVGWVIGPEGDLLARTSGAHPIVTVDVDLSVADHSKGTYPRPSLSSD